MKKFKKFVAGMLAILMLNLVVGAYTDSKIEASKPLDELTQWDFVGAPNPVDDDPTDASQYQEAVGPGDCGGAQEICQISAPKHPITGELNLSGFVDEDETITALDAINDALANGPNQYVSMRNL
mgnify:CR=1 FL=1